MGIKYPTIISDKKLYKKTLDEPVSFKKDHGYSKILIFRNNTDLEELIDKAADRTEWQCLVDKLGETTGKVDDSDESTTETEVKLTMAFKAFKRVLLRIV